MTRDERWWDVMILTACVLVGVGSFLSGYGVGRVEERQSRDAVACRVNIDSVRVVPLRWPRGPVAGARP